MSTTEHAEPVIARPSAKARYFKLSDVPGALEAVIGRRVHRSAVYRWATKGIRGACLATVQIGGVQYVREDDLWAFFEHLTEQRRNSAPNDTKTVVATRSGSLGTLQRHGLGGDE